jgi:hypothetical protein
MHSMILSEQNSGSPHGSCKAHKQCTRKSRMHAFLPLWNIFASPRISRRAHRFMSERASEKNSDAWHFILSYSLVLPIGLAAAAAAAAPAPARAFSFSAGVVAQGCYFWELRDLMSSSRFFVLLYFSFLFFFAKGRIWKKYLIFYFIFLYVRGTSCGEA